MTLYSSAILLNSAVPFLSLPTIPISTCQNQTHLEVSPPRLTRSSLEGGQGRRDYISARVAFSQVSPYVQHKRCVLFKKHIHTQKNKPTHTQKNKPTPQTFKIMDKPSHLVPLCLLSKNVFCSFVRIAISHFRHSLATLI